MREASEDWWAPRVFPVPIEAKVRVAGEFDALLYVEVDGDERAVKAVFFREHPATNDEP